MKLFKSLVHAVTQPSRRAMEDQALQQLWQAEYRNESFGYVQHLMHKES